VLSDELMSLVLLGALCVGGAVVGAVFGLRRQVAPWPKHVGFTAVAFGFLAACTMVGFLWIQWIDYDRGIRASVASARKQGYEIRRDVRGDGTVAYQVKNYVVPDGSFSVFANRSPFCPSWSYIAQWSSVCGVVAALVSLTTRTVTHRQAGA
jgi:hypothetical protein